MFKIFLWFNAILFGIWIVFWIIIPFVISYWIYIVSFTLLTFFLIMLIGYYLNKNEETKKINAKINAVKLVEQLLREFSQYLTPCLIIDSNIWMNEKYDCFFDMLEAACKTHKYKLVFFGPQFDEISNIKRNTEYGEIKNKRARLAINRIELFQKNGWLDIKTITIDAIRGVYADPLIVKLITKQSINGIACTFISDDKELRIRVRQHLNDFANGDWRILGLSELMPRCEQFSQSIKLQLVGQGI